jgi:hypothetical protein
MNWTEILGYTASVLVAVSLTMSSLARLRALNLFGALAFALYGWLVGAYPVLAVNGFIAVVNIVYLARMRPGRSEAFELLAIQRPDNRYLKRFLEFHAADIGRIFPGFDLARVEDPLVVFILRDMRPVGLVICRRSGPEDLVVELDYVIPSHRDFRCAEYFYRAWSSVISCTGVCRFLAHSEVPRHVKYLRRLGFGPAADLDEAWLSRPA